MEDTIENFYDSEQIEKNKKLTEEAKRKRVRDLNDLRMVLKTPEGRRFIWKILSNAGIFRDPFTLNSNETSYGLGRRRIGLDLLIDLNDAEPLAFAKLQSEFISEQLKNKGESKDARSSD